MARVQSKPAVKATLPLGVIASDTNWPRVEYDEKGRAKNPDEQMVYDAGNNGMLTFYNTTGFGWCLATLQISRGKRGMPDRTYATRIDDGQGVRIGSGPHVTQTVTVYVRKGRLIALKKYVDMYVSGLVRANTTRDRISSRRAQGVEMRALGRSSWRWDV